MTNPSGERPRIWTIPLMLAALVSIGLVIALVADGLVDLFASATLAGVIFFAIGKGLASQATASRPSRSKRS